MGQMANIKIRLTTVGGWISVCKFTKISKHLDRERPIFHIFASIIQHATALGQARVAFIQHHLYKNAALTAIDYRTAFGSLSLCRGHKNNQS